MERVPLCFILTLLLFIFPFVKGNCVTARLFENKDIYDDEDPVKTEPSGLGYEILQHNLSFKSQIKKPNNVYEIRNSFDLRETKENLVLNSKFISNGRPFYSHKTPLRLVAGQAIWVPQDCIVLNVTKDTVLSRNGFYISEKATSAFIASAVEQKVSYMVSGIIEIPDDCILKFNGGSLRNGIIIGQNTIIDASLYRIFDENLTLEGSWKTTEAYPQWFGARGDGINDDTCAIQKTIGEFSKIVFVKGTYLFSSQIEISRDKTVCGIEGVQNNGNVVLKTNSNITCLKIIGSGVTIENFTIEHPETNTLPVIDISGYRYISLRNIICYHYGKQCPAIGLYCGKDTWTGYDVFENCNFSHYSENVRIENGSFVSFYNCKLNRATSRHLFLGGSVFSFINCDITKAPGDTVLGVEYTGQYTIDFIGCYLEGFRLTEFAKCTNNSIGSGVRVSGSKFYLPNASGAIPSTTAYAEFDGEHQYTPNMFPGYSNGFHRSVNKIINGDFSSGFIKWEKSASITHSDILNPVELPKGQTSGKSFARLGANPGEIWQKVGKLSQGTHTIGMWLQARGIDSDFRLDLMVSDGRAGNSYNSLSFVTKKEKYERWHYINCVFDVPLDKASVDWYVRIYFRGCSAINLTGVTLYDGVYSEAGSGNSVSSDMVLTKELIIKGQDDKYYTISVDKNGSLMATEVITK